MKMKTQMPGFTAESSLVQQRELYAGRSTANPIVGARVEPAGWACFLGGIALGLLIHPAVGIAFNIMCNEGAAY